MQKVISFIKQETVLVISIILALISCAFVKPSTAYFDYINFKTLIILLVMMFIVQNLRVRGMFDILVGKLLLKVRNTRSLVLLLTMACFFSSMLITNDVSLITFVPFALMALHKAEADNLIVPTVTLQTIAANMGCMLLPVGSPHNIFMVSVSNIPFVDFLLLLLPYVIASLIFLLLICLIIPSTGITSPVGKAVEIDKRNYWSKVLKGIDFYLLLTFIAFFILIGNLQNIDSISSLFSRLINNHEVLCGILASQIISNVPAAMMLSGFSDNYKDIIIGVNIGGLGTLIASMANLIAYKILAKEYPEKRLKFLGFFTVLNVILLFVLLGVYTVIQ